MSESAPAITRCVREQISELLAEKGKGRKAGRALKGAEIRSCSRRGGEELEVLIREDIM